MVSDLSNHVTALLDFVKGHAPETYLHSGEVLVCTVDDLMNVPQERV